MIEMEGKEKPNGGGMEGEGRMEERKEGNRELDLHVSFPFTQSAVLGKIQSHYPIL